MSLKQRLLYAALQEAKGEAHRGAGTQAGAQIADTSIDPYCQFSRFGVLLARARRSAPERGPEVDDLAVIAYTSGTTGATPAGVMLTHAALASNALQLRHWAPELRPGDERILAVVPFSHSYGLTAGIHTGALIGATLILLPRFDVEETLKTIARERPSIFPGVPLMFQHLALFPGVRKFGVASIRLCISSGSPLPVEVQEEFEKLTRSRVVEAYGLTEAGPATHCFPFAGRRRHGSIGLPLPDTEAKIIDPESGKELGPEQPGELLVRGPQLMSGYWKRPKETAETALALHDGWLHTGDICRMDEDGFFYVIDRRKDILFAGGYPVYPRDIEEVLYEHPGVREAAVAADPAWSSAGMAAGAGTSDASVASGAAIHAFVVPRAGTHVTAEELLAHAKKRLPPHAVPVSVRFVAALPRNTLGKVVRRRLLDPGA